MFIVFAEEIILQQVIKAKRYVSLWIETSFKIPTMKIALLGYGKMGQEIAKAAPSFGAEIVAVIDNPGDWEIKNSEVDSANVAIEFSVPSAAPDNIRRCFQRNKPIVVGTTGWYDQFDDLAKQCREENQTLFYATNFSIGMQMLFALNKKLARWMSEQTAYEPHIEEIHHVKKLDAPSGTAITLAENLMENYTLKTSWVNHPTQKPQELAVLSQREGSVPGIHRVIYDSAIDTISLQHSAKSRQGFAFGALKAAEYCLSHHGVLTMDDLLNLS